MAELLTLHKLNEDQSAQLDALLKKIQTYEPSNWEKEKYYEGEQIVKHLGIAIPEKMVAKVDTVCGWSGTAVDTMEERLDWQKWVELEDYGLAKAYSDNNLDVDSGLGHLDALIHGIAFACVGTGVESEGEPAQLITVESARNMTGEYDRRTRRLKSAASRWVDPETETVLGATLYLRGLTIRVVRKDESAPWEVIQWDKHNLDRLPVTQLVNRPRAGRLQGRSEISKPIRAYTDAAVRTLLGMEVNRDFYTAPQRYALDIAEDLFTRADGTRVSGWDAIMGRMLAIPYDEEAPEGTKPSVGQFPQSQPGPYLEQVRGLAQLFAAECAIPPTYLGFASDQAASADAIRAMESRLVKRAERRQVQFGKAWMEVGRLVLLFRDKKIPADFNANVSLKWRDAATPTRSAAADEAVKLVGAGVLHPDSSVTYDRIGLSPSEQKQLTEDKKKAADEAAERAAAAPAPTPGVPVEGVEKVEEVTG